MITRKIEESTRTLEMLRYQAEHYRSIGRGAVVQELNAQIRRLLNEMDANRCS